MLLDWKIQFSTITNCTCLQAGMVVKRIVNAVLSFCVEPWITWYSVFITQAEQPGFKFRLSFFFFFPRSVTNRRLGSTAHASLMHAYNPQNLQKLSPCKATSSDAMISRAMKSHTDEHTVRGRATLKVVKRFRKGSVCKAYERSKIYERTFWVNLSRIMLCCVLPRS